MARLLATLEAAGILDLSEVRSWAWRCEDGVVREPSSAREVRARLSDASAWRAGGLFEVTAAQLRPLFAHGEELSLGALRAMLVESPAQLEAWERHAARLTDAGVQTPAARATAIAAALEHRSA